MEVLVTGGAGYIGSTLVPILLEQGYHVTIYDMLKWGINPLLHIARNKNIKIIKGDIRDREHIAQVIPDKDAIIHLAAVVGYPACDNDNDPSCAIDTNIMGTKNIADFIRKDQILIYASTGSCYGVVDGICTEDTKLNPLSVYGKSKSEGEDIVLSVGGIALRLATLFGLSSRMRLDLLINDLTFNALHSHQLNIYEGHFRRTFLHVQDAAHAFIFALKHAKLMSKQAYNVGDEKLNLTKIEVAQAIQRLVAGCTIDTKELGTDKDKRDYEVSYRKLSQLGYMPLISLEEGIKEMINVLPLLSLGGITKYSNI